MTGQPAGSSDPPEPADDASGTTGSSGQRPDRPAPPETDAPPASTPAAEPTDSTEPSAPGTTPARRWIGRALLATGLLLLLSVGWVGYRTYQAYRHLSTAAEQVSDLQAQIRSLDDIDLPKAQTVLDALRGEASAAVSATNDPLFRLAGHVPWVGGNFTAIGHIADTVDGLAGHTAPALIQVATTLNPAALAPRNGAIDLAPIVAASGALQTADADVAAGIRTISGIDRRTVVSPIGRALDTLQQKLTTLSDTTGDAALIGRLAPPLLGVDGPRTYLVVFQNLAEPRATGGIFGSYAVLVVDHGKLRLAAQGAGSRELGYFDPPMKMPAGLPSVLYGALPTQYATDVNLSPNFPIAAGLFAQMYRTRTGQQVDGVLALDPVALSYLIEGAPDIPIPNGLTLNSGNITSILLSTAYQLYPSEAETGGRDLFLHTATEKAFAAVTNSGVDAKQALSGIGRAVRERRLLLWSSHAKEQTDLAGTSLAGTLPSTDGTSPTIGVFRDDATGGKLGYYSGGSASLSAGACRPDGRRALTLTMPLNSAAPSSGLSPYVIGYAAAGPYVLRTNVLVFAPVSGDLTAIRRDGRPVPVVWATEGGRKVGMVTVDLKPGAHTVLTADLTAAAPAALGPTFTPELRLSPGVTTWTATATPFSAC